MVHEWCWPTRKQKQEDSSPLLINGCCRLENRLSYCLYTLAKKKKLVTWLHTSVVMGTPRYTMCLQSAMELLVAKHTCRHLLCCVFQYGLCPIWCSTNFANKQVPTSAYTPVALVLYHSWFYHQPVTSQIDCILHHCSVYCYFNTFWLDLRILEDIVSDQGPQFTSRLWDSFMNKVRVSLTC